MFGQPLGPLDVLGRQTVAHFIPNGHQRALEEAFFQLTPCRRVDGVQRVELAIDRNQLFRPCREEQPLLQHLDLGPQLEHLARRRGGHVVDGRCFQHVLDRVAGAGFHRRLVDGTGDDVFGPQHQNGGGGFGGSDAAPGPHMDGSGEIREGVGGAVAHPQYRRDQGEGHALVGVAAGIGFDGDGVGHGHLGQHFGLGGADGTRLHQFGHQLFRGGGQEKASDIGARHLGDDLVVGQDAAVFPAQAMGAPAHQGDGHLHEGRGLDHLDPVLQQQIDQLVFQGRMVDMGDEVDAERRTCGQLGADGFDRRFHLGHGQAAGAEERQHAGAAHAHHHVHRGNALVHGAAHIRVGQSEIGAEAARAQLADSERGVGGWRRHPFLGCQHGGIQGAGLGLGAAHHGLDHRRAVADFGDSLETHALGQQITQRFAPQHRGGDLFDHALADGRRVVGTGGDVGNHRHLRRGESEPGGEIGEFGLGFGHERGVKGAAHRQHHVMAGAGGAEKLFGGDHRVALARQHDLLRGVEIGRIDV